MSRIFTSIARMVGNSIVRFSSFAIPSVPRNIADVATRPSAAVKARTVNSASSFTVGIRFNEVLLKATNQFVEDPIDVILDSAFQEESKFVNPSLSSRIVGVRYFSSRASSSSQKLLEDICPFYNPISISDEKDLATRCYNNFAYSLKCRLSSLMNDGFHRGFSGDKLRGRAAVIAEYHKAFLAIEKSLIGKNPEPHRVYFNDRVQIICSESDSEKAKGTVVLARIDGVVVGRMFMANALDDHHLTFLSTDNLLHFSDIKIDPIDLQRQMLRSYFDDRKMSFESLNNNVRTSCVADYRDALKDMAIAAGTLFDNKEMFEQDGCKYHLQRSFPMRSLAKLVGAEIVGTEKTSLRGVLDTARAVSLSTNVTERTQ